jgi:hypothetical protein
LEIQRATDDEGTAESELNREELTDAWEKVVRKIVRSSDSFADEMYLKKIVSERKARSRDEIPSPT